MINTTYLSEIATKLKTDITKVLINDSIEIGTFLLEETAANVYEVKFKVLAAQTIQITNIKLQKADDTFVTNNDVDIPISSFEAEIRHTVTITEVTE